MKPEEKWYVVSIAVPQNTAFFVTQGENYYNLNPGISLFFVIFQVLLQMT